MLPFLFLQLCQVCTQASCQIDAASLLKRDPSEQHMCYWHGQPVHTLHCYTQLLKHVEEQESLDDISSPPDLAEGSRLLQDIMSSSNKVLVLGSNATLMDTFQSIV